MKKIKKLSIILACMFSLSLIPANGMVDKVSAAENNGGQAKQLKAVPYYVQSAFQYKDKTYVFGKENKSDAANSLSVVQNGQRKEIRGGLSSDEELRKVGQVGSKVYFEGRVPNGNKNRVMNIYSFDVDTNQLAVVKTDLFKEMTDKYKGKFNKEPGFYNIIPVCDASNPGGMWFICRGKEMCIANTDGYMSDEGSDWDIIGVTNGPDGSLYAEEQKQKGTAEDKIVKLAKDKQRTEFKMVFPEELITVSFGFFIDNKGDAYVGDDGSEDMMRFIRLHKDEKSNQYVSVGDWTSATSMVQDSQGNIWISKMSKKGNVISRVENGTVVDKYEVDNQSMGMSMRIDVYDQDNLVAYEHDRGYAIVSKEATPENPNGGTGNNNNNGNNGTSDKGSTADASSTTGKGLPETGSPVDDSLLVELGLMSAAAGATILLRKKN